jgi:hypothetical protein
MAAPVPEIMGTSGICTVLKIRRNIVTLQVGQLLTPHTFQLTPVSQFQKRKIYY